MKKVMVSLIAAVVLALMVGGRAQAAVIAPEGLGTAADAIATVDKVQFIYRGRRYCWYWDGWRGPGWYWCGYEWRVGLGWGGPVGWRGWRRPARPAITRPNRPGVHPPTRPNRPGVNRPGHNRPGANRPNRPGGGGAGVNRPGGGGGRPSAGGGGRGGGGGGRNQ